MTDPKVHPMKTCETCRCCGPDLDEAIYHKHESTDLTPCADWQSREIQSEVKKAWQTTENPVQAVSTEEKTG